MIEWLRLLSRLYWASKLAVTHVNTDPACKHFHAPKPGSHLDFFSRGITCPPCMNERERQQHD